MAVTPPFLFDRQLIAVRRARAARAARPPDYLLRRAAEDLGDRLDAVLRRFPLAVVLGTHHGVLSRVLRRKPAIGLVVSADSCVGALRRAPAPRVAADEEALPFRDGSLDLVASALSLHLVNDVPGTLVQIRRALRPDGLFLASVLGGGTLHELRTALMEAELEATGGASPRVAPMADTRDYGALLQRAGFALPVTDSDLVTVTYDTPLALMHDLRAMGAANALSERPRTPLRRATLMRALAIYGERFPAPGGRVRASFEIITLTGWAPHESQQRPLAPGSARVRLADALGVREHRVGDTGAFPLKKG